MLFWACRLSWFSGCCRDEGTIASRAMFRDRTLSDAAEHDAQDDDDSRERDEQIASHELEPCAYGLLSSHLSLFCGETLGGHTQKNITAAIRAPSGIA